MEKATRNAILEAFERSIKGLALNEKQKQKKQLSFIQGAITGIALTRGMRESDVLPPEWFGPMSLDILLKIEE